MATAALETHPEVNQASSTIETTEAAPSAPEAAVE